ncbi:hypothetical protein K1719_043728 [Acacia pycnantha]|nr:hypothetical protein K1719_043728 [Acacia pycnantha]
MLKLDFGKVGRNIVEGLVQKSSLVLDEFYKNLRSVGVSTVSGAGIDSFFKAILKPVLRNTWKTTRPILIKGEQRNSVWKQRLEEARQKENMDKLRRDMEKSDEVEEEDEEETDDDMGRYTEEEDDVIDEDEDEEVARFSF